MAIELFLLGYKKAFLIPTITSIYMSYVLLSFRTHYSIDIPIGMMFGAYCIAIGHRVQPYVDKLLFKVCCLSVCKKKFMEKKPRAEKVSELGEVGIKDIQVKVENPEETVLAAA